MDKIEKKDVLFIVIGIAIIGFTYFSVKKKSSNIENSESSFLDTIKFKNNEKSFLEMNEAEKKSSVEEETTKILAIQNDSTLTQQQKIEAQEAIGRENLATRTDAEMKAIAEYNLNNLMNGTTQIKDAGLPSYLTGIYT
jgi:hypothetical protein